VAASPSNGRSQLAYYAELSQVGIEMAAPIAIGAVLDSYLGISPWLVIAGTVLGFAGSMFHLMKIVAKPAPSKTAPPSESEEEKR
jgi:F0F1-type ATP synthase assembly protein I